MKMKLFYVATAMAVMFAQVVINSGLTVAARAATTAAPTAPRWWTATGNPGLNLNGKMFTLSFDRGSMSFYPPCYSPPTSPPSPTATAYTTTNRPTSYPSWTTAPPTRGVSVCLRFITDEWSLYGPITFTLSPSTTPLTLKTSAPNNYLVYFGGNRNYLSLDPNLKFWPNIDSNIWYRVCVTVDSMKNVAQVFSGSSMSIRKMLRYPYVWSGEPVIEVPGFDGQLTDVQVWDYPLRYREVVNYMTSIFYGQQGSVLTWSSIRYSLRGSTLLEDVYEWQAKQPISSKGRGRRAKGEKKKKKTRERKKQSSVL
ncbi:uncharacterized protein ABDE67_000423 [Symphorus nematophorus]